MSVISDTPAQKPLTPRQLRTLDGLIAIGLQRPTCPSGLARDLEQRLLDGTAEAVAAWTGRSLYVTKSQVLTTLRCEGQLAADAATPRTGMSAAVAVGQIAHRAVQLTHTHPGKPLEEYVRQAVIGARTADQGLDEWWATAGASAQSDMLMQVTSRVVNFIDDWPALNPGWSPRFEEPIAAKVGRLTLSCRADLVLGRPRADLKQTLLIVDLKTGALKDEHRVEAMFYALVATLRYGVAPWRSTIYSLASGEWTEGDVTAEEMYATADLVADAVRRSVAVLTEARPPLLSPGDHCRWCPVKNTCPSSSLLQIQTAAS
jgi:hypothetical protein